MRRTHGLRRALAALAAAAMIPAGAAAERAALTVTLDPAQGKAVSPLLFGLFLEDINYSADAGLYAELVRNRSFEYGSLAAGGGAFGWTAFGGASFTVEDGGADGTALNPANPHYARVTAGEETGGIAGTGWLDGIAVEAGKTYRASAYVRGTGAASLRLAATDGTVLAEAALPPLTAEWTRCEVTLTPGRSARRGLRLQVAVAGGTADCDMVSLMPEDTFCGLPIRRDLGEALAELHPAFLRFPGGCAVEGKTVESMYRWKDTVGDPAARPQGVNIWSGDRAEPYYMSYGLGFYEYFCLCEALGCLPLPVLNAGMTCPIQSRRYIVFPEDSEEFRQCVQDLLDLVAFCRAGADDPWGALRVSMGHPEPFELKYVAVGNEQWQSEYYSHYRRFVEALEAAAERDPAVYGGVSLAVANGPNAEGRDGWNYVEDWGGDDTLTALVDEHYYNSPDWFLRNTGRYDSYDRGLQAKVFLGEYASQSNTLWSAVAEAAFMTGLERNGDVVALSCYAPLFGNGTRNQWSPNLIWFDNTDVSPSVNYYVQQLFAEDPLARTLPFAWTEEAGAQAQGLSGRAGLGTWMTGAAYDNLTVTDNGTGDILFSADFDGGESLTALGLSVHRGRWSVADGRLVQSSTGAPSDQNTGDALYFGDSSWRNYTLEVDAEILSGDEGFLIPLCVRGTGDCLFWNLGGWGNTVSCLQVVSGGVKSGQESGTVRQIRLKKNHVYHLKAEVTDTTVRCWVDGALTLTCTRTVPPAVHVSAGLDADGAAVLRLVNTLSEPVEAEVTLDGFDPAQWAGEARARVLTGPDKSAVNSLDDDEQMTPRTETLAVGGRFPCTLPALSLTVIRIPHRTPEE